MPIPTVAYKRNYPRGRNSLTGGDPTAKDRKNNLPLNLAAINTAFLVVSRTDTEWFK